LSRFLKRGDTKREVQMRQERFTFEQSHLRRRFEKTMVVPLLF
jgi:hypothetical protein